MLFRVKFQRIVVKMFFYFDFTKNCAISQKLVIIYKNEIFDLFIQELFIKSEFQCVFLNKNI